MLLVLQRRSDAEVGQMLDMAAGALGIRLHGNVSSEAPVIVPDSEEDVQFTRPQRKTLLTVWLWDPTLLKDFAEEAAQ